MLSASLSLCMIVRDEAAVIQRCLASARPAVDEIIVVDTGSQDATPDLARQMGAQVHTFAWNHDFAAARNYALDQATGSWILVLDADETLVADVIPEVRRLIQRPEALAITLVRQEAGMTQVPYSLVLRLFRNRPDLRFRRAFHELVDDSVADIQQREPGWRVLHLPAVALGHTGYLPDAVAQRDKLQRAASHLIALHQSDPTDAYVACKLAGVYLQSGVPEKAIPLLVSGQHSPNLEPTLSYEIHYHLGLAQQRVGRPAEALDAYQRATEHPLPMPLKLGAYFNWASLHLERGEARDAETLLIQVLAIDPHLALAHYNLGLALKSQNRFEEAIHHYQRALALQPDYAPAHQNLGVTLFRLGRVSESRTAFQTAIRLYENQQSPEAGRLRQGLLGLGLEV